MTKKNMLPVWRNLSMCPTLLSVINTMINRNLETKVFVSASAREAEVELKVEIDAGIIKEYCLLK